MAARKYALSQNKSLNARSQNEEKVEDSGAGRERVIVSANRTILDNASQNFASILDKDYRRPKLKRIQFLTGQHAAQERTGSNADRAAWLSLI